MRRTSRFITALTCLLLTSSCDISRHSLFTPENPEKIDPAANLDRNDYRNLSNTDAFDKGDPDGLKTRTNVIEPEVPDLAEILAAPKPPKLGETKLVSIAVTDDVPLKDVLIELARLADVDIEVDAGITGGVSFRAKDRPFNEVIERLADLANLRYTMKNNVLRVERDTPYIQIYSLDFLNLERSSENSSDINTSILTGAASSISSGNGSSGSNNSGNSGSGSTSGSNSGTGGSGTNATGSSSKLTARADSDFWKQLEESIKQIIAYNPGQRVSAVTIAAQPAPVAGAIPGSLDPGVPAAPVPAAAAPAAAPAVMGATFYNINREASTLTISATDKQHELLKEFLRKVKANVSSQVLIEAKIIEVTLDEQFQSGIDWTKLGSTKVSFVSKFGAVTDATNAATFNIGKPNQLALTKDIDLGAAVTLAEGFGATRTLSSPRLHATNNQQAILTFTQNYVYFDVQVERQDAVVSNGVVVTPPQVTVNSALHTVPIGIIMSLLPSINTEANEVTLNVRPTLSRVTGTVNDPGVAFNLAILQQDGIDVTGLPANPIPVVEVRELDSVLKLKSGQVMVIGGLMQDVTDNQDNGLPGASSVPFVGNLFKGVSRSNNVKELVIFIRATIVDAGGNAAPADKSIYERFSKDPRPLNL